MVLADGGGLPLSIDIASASEAEVNLIEPLLDSSATTHVPNKLIYDKAADCDALRDRLADRDVELITPHRKNRVRRKRQDGRKLRRYRRRWKIERTVSWLDAFRRFVVRHEFYSSIYHGFAKLACLVMAVRRL
ncbi:Transposase DDE domain protein [Posidoniimonas corsicana]|uniref:Transposase DDE domain protein n=1 Tax=Posidoniimonas corsicana TaxID=1938618 RepID=A0A5C5V7X2_9BACT|nr:transposase [Posidoniimonas corsicana]TWT33852.1 Transposase DDE domain protein [Posidoniimonas corsicana]